MNRYNLRFIQKLRNLRLYSNAPEVTENQPIKFSSSPASKPTVNPLIINPKSNEMPWYQPYSVVLSVTVFLVYFTMIRQENDVDLEFNKSLYERIKGLEKQQLLQSYRHYKETGKSVEDIEKRLKEIELEETAAAAAAAAVTA